MDKEYRKALKMHLMKAFAMNKSDYKEKNQKTTSPDLVQALFATPSIVSRSRIIDALIDTPVQTARDVYEDKIDNDHNTMTNSKYCQCKSKATEPTSAASPSCNYTKINSSPITQTRRMKGGDNTNIGCGDGPTNSQTNFSVYTFGSTNQSSRSQTPSFRKRTARELSNMVLAECELVESLNLMESERSSASKGINKDQSVLELPIVLWRSKKKKFNSSVDLRFDLNSSAESSTYQHHRKPTATPSRTFSRPTTPAQNDHQSKRSENEQQQQQRQQRQESLIDEDDYLDAEGIIREQFTGPLIRHVERNYVRNITATADLLKILERMPADIDRVLAKECNK